MMWASSCRRKPVRPRASTFFRRFKGLIVALVPHRILFIFVCLFSHLSHSCRTRPRFQISTECKMCCVAVSLAAIGFWLPSPQARAFGVLSVCAVWMGLALQQCLLGLSWIARHLPTRRALLNGLKAGQDRLEIVSGNLCDRWKSGCRLPTWRSLRKSLKAVQERLERIILEIVEIVWLEILAQLHLRHPAEPEQPRPLSTAVPEAGGGQVFEVEAMRTQLRSYGFCDHIFILLQPEDWQSLHSVGRRGRPRGGKKGERSFVAVHQGKCSCPSNHLHFGLVLDRPVVGPLSGCPGRWVVATLQDIASERDSWSPRCHCSLGTFLSLQSGVVGMTAVPSKQCPGTSAPRKGVGHTGGRGGENTGKARILPPENRGT